MNITDKEKEILQSLSTGQSHKEAAKKLFMSRQTFENRLRELRFKIGAKNTIELLVWAFHNNYVKKNVQNCSRADPSQN